MKTDSSGERSPDMYAELHDLVTRWQNNAISEGEFARLQSMLVGDAGALRTYVEYIYESTGLASLVYEKDITDLAPEVSSGAADPPTRLEVLRRPAALSLAIAALAVAVLITALAFIAAPFNRERKHAGNVPPPVALVARISGTHEAVWERAGAPSGVHLAAGRVMELREGFAEVSYKNGTTMVLEGPCVLELTSEGKCQLNRGKIAVNVSTSAAGFTVETPHGSVVDLGTQFGVEVLEDCLNVVVFKGKVRATNREGKVKQLVAGQRARIGREGITSSVFQDREHRFTKLLPGRPTPLALSGCDVENNSDPPWVLKEGWNGFTRSQGVFRPREGREILWASAHQLPRHLHAEIQFDANEHTISAGEYRLAVNLGMETTRHNAVSQLLTIKLTDGSGTELPGRNNLNVSALQENRWTTYLISYTVPPESSLIGKPLRFEATGYLLPHHSICMDHVAISLEVKTSGN